MFGWEPRSLPYIVNCKSGGSDQSLKKSTTFDSHPTVSLFTTATKENVDGNRIAELSSELQSQPNSVVLDCRLCGASVGLWTFHTIPRPVEIIRLVGPTELNSESGTHDSGNKSIINHAGIGNVGISKLTSTIAGGPTPARQSFKATITLPVIGQSLRARLFNDEKFSDQVYNDQEMVQADSSDRKLSENSKSNEDTTPSGQTDQPEDGRLLQNQTIDPGCGTSGDDQTSLLEGTSVTDQGTLPQSSLNGSTEETQVKSTECVPAQKIEALENAENSIKSDSGNKVADLYPLASPVENPLMSTDAVMITSSECSEKELPSDVSDQCDSQQVSENDNSNSKEVSLADSQVTPCKSSRLEDDTNTDVAGMEESMKDKLRSDNRTTSENQAREGGDPNDKVHTSVNSMHLAHGGGTIYQTLLILLFP